MLNLDFHSVKFPRKANRPVYISSGYGLAFLHMREALDRMLKNNNEITLTRNSYEGGDIQIYFGSVWDKQRIHYKRKSDTFLAFTMFEYDKLPIEWITTLQNFDGIIVPSEYCKTVFESNLRENGIEIPVYKVPLGIDIDRWQYIDRSKKKDEYFNILWQGAYYGDRKGGELVAKILNDLDLPKTKLWVKINPRYLNHNTGWDIEAYLHQLMGFEKQSQVICRSIGKVLKNDELDDMLHKIDLSIYPSTGEGFGLIPLEHMATGIPVIISDNTGMQEYINPQYCMPVRCKEVMSYYGQGLGTGWLADENQIKDYVVKAYENRQETFEMGRKASEFVRNNYNYDNAARKLIKLIVEIKEKQNVCI